MSLSDGDKALCMKIARQIVKEVLKEHVQACPHGIDMIKWKAKMSGVVIGCSFVGGASAIGLGELVSKLF